MPSIAGFALRCRVPRALAVAGLVLALAGCFMPSPRKGEADAKAAAAYADCDQLYRAGKLKTHLAAVNCAAPIVTAAYQEAAYSFTDLVYTSIQARRVGAHKVDTGDATEAEYQHDAAELDARIAAEDRRRNEIMKFGGNARPETVEVLVQGLHAFTPTPTAAALPPTPPNAAGCFALGQIKGCP
jgi:hypothetical protein